MKQETGETRDAILEDRQKRIDNIISANKNRKDPYWIVIYAKPSPKLIDGKPALIEHIKPYASRPPSWVGAIIAEVNNQKGDVKWEINMPQRPFDFDAVASLGGKPCDEVVVETTSIPDAYVTK